MRAFLTQLSRLGVGLGRILGDPPPVDVGAGQNLNAVIKLLPGEVYENPAWKGLAYLARAHLLAGRWDAARTGFAEWEAANTGAGRSK